MKPTQIKFYKLQGGGSVKAYLDITFDDLLVVKDFKVVDAGKGPFLGLPTTKGKDGKFFDRVYPKDYRNKESVGAEFYTKLQKWVLTKWNEQDEVIAPAFQDQTTAVDNLPF